MESSHEKFVITVTLIALNLTVTCIMSYAIIAELRKSIYLELIKVL